MKAAEKPELHSDLVRERTDPDVNRRIDERMERNLQLYAKADKRLLDQRLRELDEEWDMERFLETNASSLVVGGVVLGTLFSRKFFAIPAVVGGFLLMHALHGWCPPVPLLRRLGIRTRKEIERERIALKVMRGDFDALHTAEQPEPEEILAVIEK